LSKIIIKKELNLNEITLALDTTMKQQMEEGSLSWPGLGISANPGCGLFLMNTGSHWHTTAT
jgi:hypothetical protein